MSTGEILLYSSCRDLIASNGVLNTSTPTIVDPNLSLSIIDIKDMNPEIYKRYTKTNNNQVIENLKWLTEQGLSDSLFVRVPHIPGYNTEEDIEASVHALKELGIKNIEMFQYIVQQDKDNSKYIVANGKAVCAALKQIRIDIAKSNGILYEPSICHYEGECPGTCPKCEQELNEISLQIEQK